MQDHRYCHTFYALYFTFTYHVSHYPETIVKVTWYKSKIQIINSVVQVSSLVYIFDTTFPKVSMIYLYTKNANTSMHNVNLNQLRFKSLTYILLDVFLIVNKILYFNKNVLLAPFQCNCV